jgi:hypothetical protein
MPEFYHPRAIDDALATPPSAVTVGGETVRVTDGTFHAEESAVRPLADAYGVALSELRVTDTYNCGVNGCSREVDAPDATCWQHD